MAALPAKRVATCLVLVARLDGYFLKVQGGKKLPHPEWYEAYAPIGRP